MAIPSLRDDSVIVDLGLDSFRLGVLVAQLEDEFGFDPWASGQVDFPVTFGELVSLYERHET